MGDVSKGHARLLTRVLVRELDELENTAPGGRVKESVALLSLRATRCLSSEKVPTPLMRPGYTFAFGLHILYCVDPMTMTLYLGNS